MKLALFDENRVGVIDPTDGSKIIDVTSLVPGYDAGFASNHWTRLCNIFPVLREAIDFFVAKAPRIPLADVSFRAPVLNPSKIVAAAANYSEHLSEAQSMLTDAQRKQAWFLSFDVFLKAPSAIIGPNSCIELPNVGDQEIHHEGELALIIGTGGKHISESRALSHVLGYTILVDVTVRGDGDRSRRKSYDGFCPIGPWVVTADEIPNPHDLQIRLDVNGVRREDCSTSDMMMKIPAIIAYASNIMTLNPGDVITTGSPPGVGAIRDGDRISVEIDRIGSMTLSASSVAPTESESRVA